MTLFDDNEAMRAAIKDDAEIGELRERAMQLVASVDELFEGTRADRIGEALRDENGLRPTAAALDVIMAVIRETERTDEHHGRKRTDSPTPSLHRYSCDAERALRVLRKNR
jgi:hypothetical protein